MRPMTEYVWVEIPHRMRPTVSHVMDKSELVEFLIQHCVNEKYDHEVFVRSGFLEDRSLKYVLEYCGDDLQNCYHMTKAEVIDHIKRHDTKGHQGVALLTELKKIADKEGWRTHKSMYTNHELATDEELWGQYVDPDGACGKDYWGESTVDERLDLMVEMFTNEEVADE